jgi:hypothetical protein
LSDPDRHTSITDLSAWTWDRLHAHAARLPDRHPNLETVLWVAQSNAYRSSDDREACLLWAALSLDANRRLHGDALWDQTRMLSQDFRLRTWVIEHGGPGADPTSDPHAIAADTLAALRLDPTEAATAVQNWRQLPIEDISELRRHKNLTGHLDKLINYLPPGPTRAQLTAWTEIRTLLP